MSGNVPPAAGGEEDPFAAPSPYQVTPAVADPAAAFEASLANQDDGALVLKGGSFVDPNAIPYLS